MQEHYHAWVGIDYLGGILLILNFHYNTYNEGKY